MVEKVGLAAKKASNGNFPTRSGRRDERQLKVKQSRPPLLMDAKRTPGGTADRNAVAGGVSCLASSTKVGFAPSTSSICYRAYETPGVFFALYVNLNLHD